MWREWCSENTEALSALQRWYITSWEVINAPVLMSIWPRLCSKCHTFFFLFFWLFFLAEWLPCCLLMARPLAGVQSYIPNHSLTIFASFTYSVLLHWWQVRTFVYGARRHLHFWKKKPKHCPLVCFALSWFFFWQEIAKYFQ